eukprot:315171-Rhodomonas_salina.1
MAGLALVDALDEKIHPFGCLPAASPVKGLDEDEHDWRVAQWAFGLADAPADGSGDEEPGLHRLEQQVANRLKWIREHEGSQDPHQHVEGRQGPRQ